MTFHNDFKYSSKTLLLDNLAEESAENRLQKASDKIKVESIHPNGKLLTDTQIETLRQRQPKEGDYFHRKKAGLMTSDRIETDHPVAVVKDGTFYAVYRNAQLDEPVLLGKGAFGKVKVAQDLRYNTSTSLIATKIIKTEIKDEKHEETWRQNVANELQILKEMGQASSDTLIERRSRKDGLMKFQIFMDIAKGINLHSLIREQKLPNNPAFLLKIGLNFLLEVTRLHNLGYVHRDIKTNNIFVDLKTGKVTLIDFGFGIKMNPRGNVNGKWCGTPTIMPPEILKKSNLETPCTYSKSTDIYSAGIVLFAVLFGKNRTCNAICYGESHSFRLGWEDYKKCLFNEDGKHVEVYDKSDKLQYSFEREIWNILEKMIHFQPKKRPDVSKVLKILEKHISKLEESKPGCKCM